MIVVEFDPFCSETLQVTGLLISGQLLWQLPYEKQLSISNYDRPQPILLMLNNKLQDFMIGNLPFPLPC